MYSTREVSSEVSIVSDSPIASNEAMGEIDTLPLAENLALIKEPHAYHFILIDLGLENTTC